MTADSRVSIGQWILAIAVGCTLSWSMWQGLLQDHDLNGGDTWPYFMPQKVVLAESLQRNELPLWHDLTGLGYPLLAESQAGVFYPTNQILYRLFDVNHAYSASILLHYALAFIFAWRFVRTQNVSCWPALLAALIYVYGWFPARISLEWSIIGGVWLPLTLWITHEFLHKPTRLKFALISSALATHLLAGHFTLAFINELCLVLYSLLQLWLHPRESRPSIGTAAAVPAAILVSLLLSSAQLVPSMELKQVSQRDDEGAEQTVRKFDPGYGHMPPLYLTQVVASWWWWHTPEIRASREILRLPGSTANATNAVEAHFYLGLIPLGLVLLTLLPQTHRPSDRVVRRTWWILGLAGIAYATGWLLPVTRHLPGFAYFMGPGRYTIVSTLAGSVLCGIAMDSLIRRRPAMIVGTLIIGSLTWFDVNLSSIAIADAMQVPAIWSSRNESWIRQYFDEQPQRSSRLLASGPNVGNMFGISCVPQYLGIGPAVYFGQRLDLATGPDDDRYLSEEQLQRLQDLGVTHLLTDRPVTGHENAIVQAWAAPDVMLNRIWGAARQSRYLYKLQNPGQRVFAEPADALQTWDCVSQTNHSVVFEIELTQPAVIHLRELMYPGWIAWLDGQQVTAEPSGDLLRSVSIPQGSHRLEWRFESASVQTGIWLSCLSLCGLWIAAFIPFRRSTERKAN